MYSAEEMGSDQLTLSVDGRGFINVDSHSTKLSQFAGEKMIPLQFTGFHDKKGNEIYEGDILKTQTYLRIKSVDEKDNTTINAVEFRDGSFQAWGLLSSHVSRSEVIGNIYQNKEISHD